MPIRKHNAATIDKFARSARDILNTARDTLHDETMSPRRRVEQARMFIKLARMAWARVTDAIALGDVELTHHYAEFGAHWRALVRLANGEPVYLGARDYAHRQSAQRAALRIRGRIVRNAENAFAPITY